MTIEERAAALEAEVQHLREKLADTHTLAAHADRDVAEFRDELRNQTRLININRLDMSELRVEVSELRNQTQGGFSVIANMLEQLGAQRPEAGQD